MNLTCFKLVWKHVLWALKCLFCPSRLFPRGFSGCAARSGPGRHPLLQQNRRCTSAAAGQSDPVAVSLPRLHIWCLHPGYSEPAAPSTGAQLHLHRLQHSASCSAGKREKAQGMFASFCVSGAETRNPTVRLVRYFCFLLCYSGVHEDDGSQQLAPLERLVLDVPPLPLHLSLFCDFAPLYPGE